MSFKINQFVLPCLLEIINTQPANRMRANSLPGCGRATRRGRPWSCPPRPPPGSWSESAWSQTLCDTAGSWLAPGSPSSSGRCRLCRSGACRPTWRDPGRGRSRWRTSGLLSGCLWGMWQRPWSSVKSVTTEEEQQTKDVPSEVLICQKSRHSLARGRGRLIYIQCLCFLSRITQAINWILRVCSDWGREGVSWHITWPAAKLTQQQQRTFDSGVCVLVSPPRRRLAVKLRSLTRLL